jgi:hypothetical protein
MPLRFELKFFFRERLDDHVEKALGDAGDMAFNAYFTSSSRRLTARSPGLPSIIRGS